MEVLVPGSVGNSMVTGVSSEQYREINEFGLSEQSRLWAAFGNGKGKYGEPSLGIQTRKSSIYGPTTNCIPLNRSDSNGEEETLARQV